MATTDADRKGAFAALVTAAGASTRMGAPKSLVSWQGRPLLEHQLGALASVDAVGEIVVVLGKDAPRVRAAADGWPLSERVRFVENPNWEEGRSSSIEVAARALTAPPRSGIVIVAVDQPLEAEVLGELLAAWRPDDRVLLPSHLGRRGHPVVLASALLPELVQASRHPQGLRDIVHDEPPRAIEVASDGIFADLNTPDDLARRV